MKLRRFYLACFLSVGCLAAPAASAANLIVIDLRYRAAADVIPVLRPLVPPDVALSGVDYKLLVRGDANAVAKIREVLAVIDRAPRQFLVSVRYADTPQSRDSEIGSRVGSNDRGAQIAVRGGAVTQTASDRSVSSVRVLEGNSAHISTGQSVPIVTAAYVAAPMDGRGTGIGLATDYRNLLSGFDVLPRVNGEQVTLEISTQQQRAVDSNSGATSLQRVSTTVGGQLGEWIELGGSTSSFDEQRSGIAIGSGGRRTTTRGDQRSVAVKVEPAD